MTDEVTAFLTFTLVCSAIPIGLLLLYAHRLNRLRAAVRVFSQVNDLVPQRAPAPRD
ncbi:hypothetical protein LPW26_15310 [Rhodopseudomonas sp. HC1]|uniref:hypothetical protein n=1 Tax=Rhodopseudomonas infernalis TaxID=2897386 RepID=UPI001EE89DBF|nr:hypothetical protein [Rhodopseudomonas infernalis]MCG6206017.1 hypothetical protein [Rhodopseudomonas infernalis]